MTIKTLLNSTLILCLLSLSSAVFACEGSDRQESLGLIYKSLELSADTAYTNNIKDMVKTANQIKLDKSKLSPSCQSFIDQIVGSMQRLPPAGETQCYNNVCCTSSACTSK